MHRSMPADLSHFIALILVGLAAAANVFAEPTSKAPAISAAQWRGNGGLPRLLPSQQIVSVTQTIIASGDLADIYYPTPSTSPHSAQTKRFPLVILLQGGLVDKKYYSHFAQELARYGFVVIVPNHLSPLFGNDLFMEMKVINQSLMHAQAENIHPDSPLYGIVDTTHVGLSGHSFGGAAALFAIGNFCGFPFCSSAEGYQLPPEVQAAALVAGNSGTLDLDTSGVPVAILIGDLDTGLQTAERTYATLEPPRALIRVHGANHFGLTDIDQPPGAQERPTEARQSIPQAITASRFAYWSGLFLRAHLNHDRRAWRRIYRSDGDQYVTIISSTPVD